MSIVKIKFHTENIFKADSQDDQPILPPKSEMYRSKFEKSIREHQKEMHNARHLQHRTFGLAEMDLPSPDNFLKKAEGTRRLCERPQTSHHRCTFRRPPIPHFDDQIDFRSNEEKNFKLINIKRAKTATLRNKPGPKCFEQTPPVYKTAPKFGQVPQYLTKMNEKMKRIKLEAKQRREVELRNDQKDIRVISQEEKNELLHGLRHNWDLMQKDYQKMPLLIDTVPKMIRKTKLENSLKSLERDICLLNSNKNCIFILPD